MPAPTALEILEATAAAMESVDSFHLDMNMRIDLGAGGATIQVPITVAADFQAPDRSRGTLSMSFLFLKIESQFVTIGDDNYVTDPETGEWGLGGDTVTPLLDPDAFIGRGAIAEVRGLEMLGNETLEGVDVYHLAGALTPDVIGEAGASGDMMVSYWIGVEDSLVRRIEANGDIGLDAGEESLFGVPADSASLSMTLTFSDYGGPVTIEAPEVASAGVPPTPTPAPTPTPTPVSQLVGLPRPPSVSITGPDEAQQGVAQSYVSGGAFIDYLGRGYPADEVSLAPEALLLFRLDPEEEPGQLVMYIYPEGTGAGPFGQFPDSFLSRVDVPVLPLEAEAVSVAPGSYEVALHAVWGDMRANYGFSVVLPSQFRVAARTSNPPATLPTAPPAPAGMAQPRSDHTATLLTGGRVLVTGGLDIELNALFSVEVYDAASGAWSASSAMSEARRDHTATLLPDGRVLVAGGHGIDAEIHASTEIFDPSDETWTSAGDMSEARLRHTATLLQNGRVLVVGGPSNTAEVYDPSSGTWTVTDGMAHWREFHTATLLDDGSLLVAGGVDNAVSVLAGAEIYDPTGAWYAADRMAQARRAHTSTLLSDGTVLVIGGLDGLSGALDSAEIYDPFDGRWSAVTSMDTARALHTATLLGDGTVLVAGGEDANGPLASSEIFDPTSATWSPNGRMAQGRIEHTATLLGLDTVLVAGGASLVSVEAYQPGDGTWVSNAETATP
jgi:hypothetical protein